MAITVAGIDLLYATSASPLPEGCFATHGLRLALGLTSAAILISLGCRTFCWAFAHVRDSRHGTDAEPKRAFLTATAGTALNPLTIALWAISFPAAATTGATVAEVDVVSPPVRDVPKMAITDRRSFVACIGADTRGRQAPCVSRATGQSNETGLFAGSLWVASRFYPS